MPDFGLYLQAELNRRGWSYSDFATRSGLHVSLISRVARGQRKPTPTFVQRCADALAMPLGDVMTAAGMIEEAVVAHGTPEAQALQHYIDYAATDEGEEEIAARLPEKLAKVQKLPDATGKLALLLDWVTQLTAHFWQSSGAKKALIGGALLYFLSPVDLVPDFIPIAGLLDDLTVVSMVLGMIATPTDGGGTSLGGAPHV